MSHKITIELTTGNAAFTDNESGEVARILHKLADKLDAGYTADDIHGIPVRDVNGNSVGSITVAEE